MSSGVETSLRFLDFARNDSLSVERLPRPRLAEGGLSVERWALNSYTHALTQEQVAKLRALLDELGFKFAPKEWTVFFGQKNKLSVAVSW